jgi:hypothetical protein
LVGFIQVDVGKLVLGSYAKARVYCDGFEVCRQIYEFSKIWELAAYEKQQHDVRQFRKDVRMQVSALQSYASIGESWVTLQQLLFHRAITISWITF